MSAEDLNKILNRCKPVDGCLEYGNSSPDVYPTLWFRGKCRKLSRLIYTLAKGEIPGGHFVCHSCDNPKCINPDHLWVGTPKQNYDDMANKGRAHVPRPGTHCKRGHLYTPETEIWKFSKKKRGWGRTCRECVNQCHRRYKLRKRMQRLSLVRPAAERGEDGE